MAFVIAYDETAEEIAADVEAVRESAGKGFLDLIGVTPEEYVADWSQLYLCEVYEESIDKHWSFGGVEPYEAYQFAAREDAEAWLDAHGDSEPGTFTVWEV